MLSKDNPNFTVDIGYATLYLLDGIVMNKVNEWVTYLGVRLGPIPPAEHDFPATPEQAEQFYERYDLWCAEKEIEEFLAKDKYAEL